MEIVIKRIRQKTEEKDEITYKLWAPNKDLGMSEMPDRKELDKLSMDYIILTEWYSDEELIDENGTEYSLFSPSYENAKFGDEVSGEIVTAKVVGFKIVPIKYEKQGNDWFRFVAFSKKEYKNDEWKSTPLVQTPEELDAEANK